MKGKLICILGVDGSGKSTFANRLVSRYNTDTQKIKYIWGGCNHYLTWPFVAIGKRVFLHKTNQYGDYEGYQHQIHTASRNRFISKLYQILIFIDYLVQVNIKIRIPLLCGTGVITDRYVYGTIIDLAVHLGYSERNVNETIRRLLSYSPKPDYIFLIDVPEDVAFSRKDDIPSLDYLRCRRQRYLALASNFNITILDGLKEPHELEKFAVTAINELSSRGEQNE